MEGGGGGAPCSAMGYQGEPGARGEISEEEEEEERRDAHPRGGIQDVRNAAPQDNEGRWDYEEK